MEPETAKQTPQSNSVLSNPSHPGVSEAGTELHMGILSFLEIADVYFLQ